MSGQRAARSSDGAGSLKTPRSGKASFQFPGRLSAGVAEATPCVRTGFEGITRAGWRGGAQDGAAAVPQDGGCALGPSQEGGSRPTTGATFPKAGVWRGRAAGPRAGQRLAKGSVTLRATRSGWALTCVGEDTRDPPVGLGPLSCGWPTGRGMRGVDPCTPSLGWRATPVWERAGK